MRTVKFQTEPFTCPSCVQNIESVVNKLDGVASTRVLFNASKVKVTFDEDALPVETIARIITELGYPVLSQKAALPA